MVLKTCESCGAAIKKESNRSWNSYAKKRFCSITCAASTFSKKEDVQCMGCGKNVQRSPSHVKARVYCSVKCRSTITDFTCEQCGCIFQSRPVWRNLTHIYCGNKCASLAKRKYKEQDQCRRSSQDLAWKEEVFRANGRKCQMCGSSIG